MNNILKRNFLFLFFAAVFVMCGFFVSAQSASAATETWIGTTNHTWTVNGNWSSGVAPKAGDDVIINTDQSANITNVPTISLDSLTISGNVDLEGSADNVVTVTGTFNVASGKTLTLGSISGNRVDFDLSSTGTGTIYGTVKILSGTTNRYFQNDGNLTIASAGLITDNGGSDNSDFILSSGATLQIGSTAGITSSGATGNIQVSGTRTFSTGANYVYNGTISQVIGSGLPATVNNLTINNTGTGNFNIVMLSQAETVNGNLTIISGNLATNNSTLTLNGNFTNSGILTAGNSAITIGGTGTQSIAGFTTAGTVSMTKTAGVATFMGPVNGLGLTINGPGGTLNLGSGLTHVFTGLGQ